MSQLRTLLPAVVDMVHYYCWTDSVTCDVLRCDGLT